MFSGSSTGSWAELQLPSYPNKQGEPPENMLQHILHNLPPQTETVETAYKVYVCPRGNLLYMLINFITDLKLL